MRPFRRFVNQAPLPPNPEAVAKLSDKIITPATVVTASRPVLAHQASRMLVRGERWVTPVIMGMALTDMEGVLARFIDKKWPEWGRGATRFGVAADKYADTGAIIEVAAATLLAPQVTAAGKLAVATIFGQEGGKISWAIRSGLHYKQATGETLDFAPSPIGKEAMAEKFIAVCAAAATSDTDSPALRAGLSATALSFAGLGVLHGEAARRDYAEQVATMLAEAEACTALQVNSQQYVA